MCARANKILLASSAAFQAIVFLVASNFETVYTSFKDMLSQSKLSMDRQVAH
jgi:hypothetical protein